MFFVDRITKLENVLLDREAEPKAALFKHLGLSLSYFQRTLRKFSTRPSANGAHDLCAYSRTTVASLHPIWQGDPDGSKKELEEFSGMLRQAIESLKEAKIPSSDFSDTRAREQILLNLERRLKMIEIMSDDDMAYRDQELAISEVNETALKNQGYRDHSR